VLATSRSGSRFLLRPCEWVFWASAMTNVAIDPDKSPIDEAALDCCGHPESAHDAVAKRFCAATQRSALVRGCICHSHTGAQRFR
jgi:hypothetical protein